MKYIPLSHLQKFVAFIALSLTLAIVDEARAGAVIISTIAVDESGHTPTAGQPGFAPFNGGPVTLLH